MFSNNKNLVIAITTFDLDALRISLPPLRRFMRGATLVIHNDNPNVKLDRAMVRKMGWRGDCHIINVEENRGELESRMAVVDFVLQQKIHADWMVFVNDDDVLINAGIPNVDDNVYAIIQNATVISDKITDMFKISESWINGTECGVTGPRFDITGPTFRIGVLAEYFDFIKSILPQIYKISNETRYYLPWGNIMWIGINTFVRVIHPEMSPMYMNQTNYVAVKMGRQTRKYGRAIPIAPSARDTYTKICHQYSELFDFAIKQNMVAQNQ